MSLQTMFINSIANWNVGAIKDDLRAKGLDISGDKATIVERLQTFYINSYSPVTHNAEVSSPPQRERSTGQPGVSSNVDQLSSRMYGNILLDCSATTTTRHSQRLTTSSSAQYVQPTLTLAREDHSQQRQITPCPSESHPYAGVDYTTPRPGSLANSRVGADNYPARRNVGADNPSERANAPIHVLSYYTHGKARDNNYNMGSSAAVTPMMSHSNHVYRHLDITPSDPTRATSSHPPHVAIMSTTEHLLHAPNPMSHPDSILEPQLFSAEFRDSTKSLGRPVTDRPQQTSSQAAYPGSDHISSRRMSSTPMMDELATLEMELKILTTKDAIRSVQHRLSRSPEELKTSDLYATGGTTSSSDLSMVLSLVKKSVDISSLPPAKPIVFAGDPLQYPKWKSSFDLLIENKDLSAPQKLSYLQTYLSGKALECIEGYVMFNTVDAYEEARKVLDERFGDPFEIADAFRDKLESWPKIGTSDSAALRKYADYLKQCKLAMKLIPELDKLNDPRELKNLVCALPRHLLQRWSRQAGLRKLETKRNPVFEEYANFVINEAQLACDSTTSLEALTSAKKTTPESNTRASLSLATQIEVNEKPARETRHCHHCKTTKSHLTAECRQLSKMTYTDLQAFMRQERLCFKCLETEHTLVQCTSDVKCFKCKGEHPTCMHLHRSKPAPASDEKTTPANTATIDNLHNHKINTSQAEPELSSMIVPVYISSKRDPSREILTYALIDSMSDSSFIVEDLSDSLYIDRERKQIKVSTVTTQDSLQWSDKIYDLQIRGFKSAHTVNVPTLYSQKTIPANRNHIPTPSTAARWKHLQGIKGKLTPLQSCNVGLIIGYNCSAASLPLNTVRDESDLTQPYAVETILGWSIVGGKTSASDNQHVIHRIFIEEVATREVLRRLEDDLTVIHDQPAMSQNDVMFLKQMEQSITTTDGFYTMPLPFKQRPLLPDNRSYALRRFHSLESRLASNAELNLKYHEFMDDILQKGEAERVVGKQIGSWYIPHHGVFHPHKPGKLRVVYDCSATFRGQSLNKNLFQGPDLNNSLAGLLCRFRKERVAVTCDIKKMFHQFRVSEEDRNYLRFLWYAENSKEIVDYRMNVHLFGAVSSPACAIYGLKRIANDYAKDFPEAAAFVKDNFYVDDGLASVASAAEAIQLIEDSKSMLEKGNLVLHKFLSNNDEVAGRLGCDGPATKVISNEQALDRALGLCWDVKQDIFKFVEVPIKSSTRRGILSTVASLFDPLGFLTPFTLKGKLLLQALCYDKKNWDDPLSSDQEKEWNSWTDGLRTLTDLHIDRCFLTTNLGQSYDVELHTFSDASTAAYGVCAYLRFINRTTDVVSVSLVMGKSRVAPKKVVTIPRLELQAATLAVKVGGFLQKELKYEDISCFYWTDSEAVLGYITNESKKFHIFVSNRVQRIRDSTNADQWGYISTKENPADIASRGSDVSDLPSSWIQGPSFLQDAGFRREERHSSTRQLDPNDPEIKTIFAHTVRTDERTNILQKGTDILEMLGNHSTWKSVTRIMSFILRCGSKDKTQDFSPDGWPVLRALIRLIQTAYFPAEIHALRNQSKVCKSSQLYDLDPFLDREGIMRVGGRLNNSLSTYAVKHPALVSSKSNIVKVYIRHKHKEVAHQGRTTTVNAVRSSGIHITGSGVKTISSIIHNCVKCKRLRGNPVGQRMADLPEHRTEPSAPFTHTGMDVFGPFLVKDGRSERKRYGLLLTCMASRAIHLEVLDDMTSDCFINSLRNFLAIRGPVSVLYSDRGTNFVGAESEFQKELMNMSNAMINRFLEERQCSFSFNVPTASHMGGTWERMIRTVRSVMSGILTERNSIRLDSSGLRTLMYECMYIVNSRPLTTLNLNSDKATEPLPLTPNNLLTMKQTTLLRPPGNFSEADIYARKRWRRVQYLAEQFWSRWKLEYLQGLQRRNKWIQGTPNLKPGDVILLVENDLPRSEWQLGRILEVMPSRDGLVRKTRIKTGSGQILDRPVHKLILMSSPAAQ